MLDHTRQERHILLKEVGVEGVEKLHRSSVLVIGAGGLGSPVLLYLAAAGVGTIGIMDGDVVEMSNLQRQIIHTTTDLGTSKVRSAMAKCLAIDPSLRIVPIAERLTPTNAKEIIPQYDIVVDCTDSYESKFLINDSCVALGKPFVHGSILRFTGQVMTYTPRSACYRCLYPSAPKDVSSAAEVGVLGPAVGAIGAMQAIEVIKILTHTGEPLVNCIQEYDALTASCRKLYFEKNNDCVLHH